MTPPLVCGDSCVLFVCTLSMTGKSTLYKRRGHFILSTQIQVSILYQSDTGYPITLHYIYLQQGAASQFVLDSTDDVVIDTVNGYEAYIFVAADQENDSNAITWIDTQSNIQFTVQAQMSTDDLVHMAESVSLVNSTKIE